MTPSRHFEINWPLVKGQIIPWDLDSDLDINCKGERTLFVYMVLNSTNYICTSHFRREMKQWTKKTKKTFWCPARTNQTVKKTETDLNFYFIVSKYWHSIDLEKINSYKMCTKKKKRELFCTYLIKTIALTSIFQLKLSLICSVFCFNPPSPFN